MDLSDVRVVLVNAFEDYGERGSERAMRALLAERGIRWPVVAGDASLRRLFRVRQIPSLFVFDGDGRLVRAFRRSEGPPPTREELASYLSARGGTR
ncbi:MAG: hypothetical protein D6689_00680 [Deltaproteobacteria bacterium]|nr:MAG: hypothetical protein D6689_00680 [Deltaproteobacteria bacterium]